MSHKLIRSFVLIVVAFAAVLLATGQASALSPDACEQFGGRVVIIPATITKMPKTGQLDSFGEGRCKCEHLHDTALDQQPVYGLTWMNDGNGLIGGFYQCIM